MSSLRHAYMFISAQLEDILEAMDEAPNHRRTVVDSAGWHTTSVGLVVDG